MKKWIIIYIFDQEGSISISFGSTFLELICRYMPKSGTKLSVYVLSGFHWNVLFQCAAAVDNLAAFYFNNITMGEAPTSPAAINLARHIVECPTLFPEVSIELFRYIYMYIYILMFTNRNKISIVIKN